MKKFSKTSGFSLIEALATVAIIGIITFLALPNVVRARQDAEASMAVARAESLNMAIASLVQTRGFAAANTDWVAASDIGKYDDLRSYLAYAPSTLAGFVPEGYTVTLPPALVRPLDKVLLFEGEGDGATEIFY